MKCGDFATFALDAFHIQIFHIRVEIIQGNHSL
jgi:hypothetical protein